MVDVYFASVKLLCGVEASQGPVQEVLLSTAKDENGSSEELDSEGGNEEIRGSRKKKNKRRKGNRFHNFDTSCDLWSININGPYSVVKNANDHE